VPIRTGQQYVDSLRDGREVWHAGRHIVDIPSHPGFAGAVATLAGLYDLQHDPDYRDVMSLEWNGDRISYSYFPSSTAEELLAKRRNVEVWSDRTFGCMGRFPDFCAALTVGLLDSAEWLGADDPRYCENARRYYRYAAERDLCLTHALNDQYYDRTRRASEQDDPDLMLHVVRETSEGPIVRGVRALATLAPLSDEALVYPNRPRDPDELDYANAFAIPMNAPGLKVICRDLYAEHADPERLPLTARFDEVDATLVFDDVLVPWDRVFVYRDPARAAQLHGRINLWASYSTLIRLLTRLEGFIGVAMVLTDWSGRSKDRAEQVRIGQLVADTEVLRACLVTAEIEAYRSRSGYLVPRTSSAHRLHGIEASDRADRLLEDILTSSVILTGGASDLASAEIGSYVERWFRNQAPSTRDHLRMLAVAADLVESAFASRNQLYERLQSGEPDQHRVRLYSGFDRARVTERLLRFIREEMGS
jgi:4-hydroxyphenylacetate 3-monooxygenase/anthranilate 3-monooxygenase (FAD)/4-hydroxyphenylacetate 3-monooxygenase